MKINREFWYKCWKYFRDGYSTYVGVPLSIFNFATVTFYLMIQKIPALNFVLPNFWMFATLSLVIVVPLSVLSGWLHNKRTAIYSMDALIVTESNKQGIAVQYISLVMTKQIYDKLGITPTPEWYALYDWYKKLDDKWKWRP